MKHKGNKNLTENEKSYLIALKECQLLFRKIRSLFFNKFGRMLCYLDYKKGLILLKKYKKWVPNFYQQMKMT